MEMEKQVVTKMDKFIQQIEDVRKLIKKLCVYVGNVQTYHVDMLSYPISDERKMEEMDRLMSRVKTISCVIHSKLKNLDEWSDQETKVKSGYISATLRIRKAQHSSLWRKFIDIITDYQKTEEGYRDAGDLWTERIKRQLDMGDAGLTDDQIANLIEEGTFLFYTLGGAD